MARWTAVLLVAVAGLVFFTGAPGAAAPKPQVIQVTAGPPNEFTFTPKEISVQAGTPVTLTVANKGKIEHDLVIEALKVKVPAPPEHVIAAGKTASVTFTPSKKGSYEFWCTVPGHKEIGMKGALIVK